MDSLFLCSEITSEEKMMNLRWRHWEKNQWPWQTWWMDWLLGISLWTRRVLRIAHNAPDSSSLWGDCKTAISNGFRALGAKEFPSLPKLQIALLWTQDLHTSSLDHFWKLLVNCCLNMVTLRMASFFTLRESPSPLMKDVLCKFKDLINLLWNKQQKYIRMLL